MNTDQFNTDKVTKYWIDEATESLKVAWHLYEKNDFSYSLFFGQSQFQNASLPRSAWECIPDALRPLNCLNAFLYKAQSALEGIPTQSVGTRNFGFSGHEFC